MHKVKVFDEYVERIRAAWLDLYGEDVRHPSYPTTGTLSTYETRGWCRLEIVAALAPKKLPSGDWRPGPRRVTFRYHHDLLDAGLGPDLTAASLQNPTEGVFALAADADLIGRVLRTIAHRYHEYEASGSTAWDATCDVRNRPAWLRNLALINNTGADES